MNKGFIAVVFLLFGVVAGSTVSRHFARQHQHPRAVMSLLQFHVDRFQAAVRSNDCAAGAREVQALQFLAGEIAPAFPLADAQDRTFHDYAQRLHALTPSACTQLTQMLKRVNDACDACHRDYRG